MQKGVQCYNSAFSASLYIESIYREGAKPSERASQSSFCSRQLLDEFCCVSFEPFFAL